MDVRNTVRTTAGRLMSTAQDFVQRHEDRIGRGLERAARKADSTTKGKYHGRIETGTDKAKDALGRFSHRDRGTATGSGPDVTGGV